MWARRATRILVLITIGVITAVFTVPSLGWLTKAEGALGHWPVYTLIFLAVVECFNSPIRPQERSHV